MSPHRGGLSSHRRPQTLHTGLGGAPLHPPLSPPQHQQQVVQAVERAKQVTMSDLNAAIGVRRPSAPPPTSLLGTCR